MSEWKPGTLSSVIESLDAGVSVNAEDRPHGSGEIGVLKTSALSGGVFRPQENKAVLPHERGLVAEPVQGDSILVSRMNTPALVGESCYVADPHRTLYLPDRIWQLKPKKQVPVNMRWLSFVLQSDVFRRYVEVHATGTSGSMKNLPKSRLLSFSVAYPGAKEQQCIADVLDKLNTAILETEALVAKLKSAKQGLLHDLLTRGVDAHGELRPVRKEASHLYKISSLGWVPKDWTVVEVREAGEVKLGRQRSPSHEHGSHMRPYLRVANVFDGYIDYSDILEMNFSPTEQKTFSVLPGDIFLNEGQSLELVGRSALYDGPPGIYCFQNTLVRFRAAAGVVPKWARMVFKYWLDTQHFTHIAKQTTSVAHLGADRFAVMAFPLPSTPEQKMVVEQMETLSQREVLEKAELTKLKQLKMGLMDDLLTGRKRVTALLNSAP